MTCRRPDLKTEAHWEEAFGTQVWHVDMVDGQPPEVYGGEGTNHNEACRECVRAALAGDALAVAAILICSTDNMLLRAMKEEEWPE